MLVAIPTINQKVITRQLGRLTEITFIEFDQNNKIIQQYVIPVSKHISNQRKDKESAEKRHNRREVLFNQLCKAECLVYRSLCKDWLERFSQCNIQLIKVNSDLLPDIIDEFKNLESI